MDKIVGLPRGIFYYYQGDLIRMFLNNLGVKVLVSPKSNKSIYEQGCKFSNDEMCSALKMYFGHVEYLANRADLLIIPRVNNYGIDDQMCTNFFALYDICSNLFNIRILNYNIDYTRKENECMGLYEIGRLLGYSINQIKVSYAKTKKQLKLIEKERINLNYKKLLSKKIKILVVGHPYVLYDELFGKQIIKNLEEANIEIIYCDKFNKKILNEKGKEISKTSYFKYSKEIIGSIKLAEKYIDGIIFLSSFPCALDSIATNIAIYKTKLPNINIILDEINSTSGIETRLESFIDILERKKKCLR